MVSILVRYLKYLDRILKMRALYLIVRVTFSLNEALNVFTSEPITTMTPQKIRKKTAWYLVDLDNARMSYGWFHAGGANFTYSLYEYIQEMDLQPGDTVYTKEQQEEDLKTLLKLMQKC